MTSKEIQSKDYLKLIINTIKLPKESHLALSKILNQMYEEERQKTIEEILIDIIKHGSWLRVKELCKKYGVKVKSD